MSPTVTKEGISKHKIEKRDDRVPLSPAVYYDEGPLTNYEDLEHPSVGVKSGEKIGETTPSPPSERLVIKGEEVGIVIVILLLWIGAIALFFNRWGKIRMLEPYQPKFCEAHRASCPMPDVSTIQHFPRNYSKFNVSSEGSPYFAKCTYQGNGSGNIIPSLLTPSSARPRQNSVFVTSSVHSGISSTNPSKLIKNNSRRTKSAIDLSTIVLSEELLENVRRSSKNLITHL